MTFIKKKQPSSLKELSDSELVSSILVNENPKNQRLFQVELYNRYVDKVYSKCISLVKNKEIAKDLTHDIWVKIFLKLHTFRKESQIGSWIYSITYNHCMTFLKKKNRMKIDELTVEKVHKIPYDKSGLENKILQELQFTQLEEVFEQLNEGEKLILMMYYDDGFSVKGIAKSLKLTEGAVKMRLKRSRDRLAELLESLRNQTKAFQHE